MSTDNSVSTWWAAPINVATAILSLCLLATALYGYGYHSWKMSRLPQKYIRLVVTGPTELCRNKDNLFTIKTETLNGDSIPAEIHFVLSDSDGVAFLDYRENCDQNGELTVNIESATLSESRLGSPVSGLTLNLVAENQGESQTYSTYLPINSEKSSFSELMEQSIPKLAYTLNDSPLIQDQGTQLEMIPLEVNNSNIPPFPMRGMLENVLFYPEGGRIIADLENRIWIWVDTKLNNPNMKGVIVDQNNNIIEQVVFNSFALNSYFVSNFTFTPKYNTRYALVLTDNLDNLDKYPHYILPTALRASRFTAIAKQNIISAGESSDFSIFSNYKSLPLIVQLQWQGNVIYRQPVVTRGSKYDLSISVPPQIRGLVQVSFFDSGLSKPTPTIQSWIYCKDNQTNSAVLPALEKKDKGVKTPLLAKGELSPEQESSVVGVFRHAFNSPQKLVNTTVSTPFIYDNYPFLRLDLSSLMKEYYQKSQQAIISTSNVILILGITLLFFVVYLHIAGFDYNRWGSTLVIVAALLSICVSIYLIHIPQADETYQTFFTNWSPNKID